MSKKLKYTPLTILILILGAAVVVLFWKQNWLILHIPFGNFTSIGQIKDEGFIGDWGGGSLVLANLPSCKTVNDFYTDQGSPRKKYTLESKNLNLEGFLYKPVKVWGKVHTETKTLTDMVCMVGPCVLRVTERTMFVDKIEINHHPLSSCQKAYLEEYLSRPRP